MIKIEGAEHFKAGRLSRARERYQTMPCFEEHCQSPIPLGLAIPEDRSSGSGDNLNMRTEINLQLVVLQQTLFETEPPFYSLQYMNQRAWLNPEECARLAYYTAASWARAAGRILDSGVGDNSAMLLHDDARRLLRRALGYAPLIELFESVWIWWNRTIRTRISTP
ncbi:MAG: hypothetical protein FRX48_03850 [Lasallia pustulata]|uniref:Uncharacterized protein n=1 Tax=Lasallia pustulata TaxID=136370 RepID=A0A5M8PV04_9LECA|nr:MAG: hypothetical protein FRX48_03850 [Lasallia pustulata]